MAACGFPTCPASCRTAGTSGSETKFFQPAASQSNITQTRSVSVGSANTVAPFEPCKRRLSAPFVEKMRMKRSTSTTLVVARSIVLSPVHRGQIARRPNQDAMPTARAHREDSLCRGFAGLQYAVLDRIEGRRRARRDADFGIDALDMVIGGLGRN